ncbi:hypothetical protein [Streptomyces sp. NPDC020996]|uniref:hypothetical protein n=1 Tax=Streptomyces sp. NPDC020996 TaxID=3154791 RepID=UPI0033C3AA15
MSGIRRSGDSKGDRDAHHRTRPQAGTEGTLAAPASGKGVQIMPVDVELTARQAADVRNVSRPYLIGLLDDETFSAWDRPGRRSVTVGPIR